MATIFFFHNLFGVLLFKGGIYSFGEPMDISNNKLRYKFENGTGFATIKYINLPKFTQLMHTQTHLILNPACTYVHGVISDTLFHSSGVGISHLVINSGTIRTVYEKATTC